MIPYIPRFPNRSLRISEFKEFLSHPVKIFHSNYTSATANALVTTDIMAFYLTTIAAQPIFNKFKNLTWFKGDIKITAVVQGQPFAAGRIVLVFEPISKFATTSTLPTIVNVPIKYSYVNSRIMPHITIDPSQSMNHELTLPCYNSVGHFTLKGADAGSYRMVSQVFNALTSGTAVTPNINVCVYMSFDNIVCEAITMLSSNLSTEKAEETKFSTIVSGISEASSYLSGLPVVGPGITLFSEVTGVLGKALAWFGFSKPPLVEIHKSFLQLHAPYSQNNCKNSMYVLGGSQEHSVGLSPSYAGGEMDDMEIKNIVSIPGLVKQVAVTQAMAAGTLVDTIHVFPTNCGTIYTTRKDVTPLAGIAAMFEYYAADFTVTVEIVASVFHRATLLIAWDPNIDASAPTLDEALQILHNQIIHVSGNSCTEVILPWMQIAPVKQVPDFATTTTNNYANGKIYVFVVNPVLTNGSTDGLSVNIYFSTRNFKFFSPSADLISGKKWHAEVMTSSYSFFEPPSPNNFTTVVIEQVDLEEDEQDLLSVREIWYYYVLQPDGTRMLLGISNEYVGEGSVLMASYPVVPVIEANVLPYADQLDYILADDIEDGDIQMRSNDIMLTPTATTVFGTISDFSQHRYRSWGDEFRTVKQVASRVSVQFRCQITDLPAQYWVGIQYPAFPLVMSTLSSARSTNYNSYVAWLTLAFAGFRGGLQNVFHFQEATDFASKTPVMGNHCLGSSRVNDELEINGGTASTFQYTNGTSALADESKEYGWMMSNRAVNPNVEFISAYQVPWDLTTNRLDYFKFPDNNIGAVHRNVAAAPSPAWVSYYMGAADDFSFVKFLGFPIIE